MAFLQKQNFYKNSHLVNGFGPNLPYLCPILALCWFKHWFQPPSLKIEALACVQCAPEKFIGIKVHRLEQSGPKAKWETFDTAWSRSF
jgi:hypothetical protein